MLRLIKLILVPALISNFAIAALAQGTVVANLLPAGPSTPPLAGFATLRTPDTNTGGFLFPVSFEVTVNSDQYVFDGGRIEGPSTALVFDLGTPLFTNGWTFFSGTTDMQRFQIDDILHNSAKLEIFDNSGFTSYLVGTLVPIPEPQSTALFTVGVVLTFCEKRLRRRRKDYITEPEFRPRRG